MYPDRSVLLFSLALSGTVVVGTLTMGQPNRAVQAAEVVQMAENRKAEADRLFEQGNKLLGQNQNEGAISVFQKALAIYRELKQRQKEGQTLKSIGNAYNTLKDYPKAIDYQKQALSIAQEIQDRDLEARSLNNIGFAHGQLKHSEEAISFYQQSLAVSRSSQNWTIVETTTVNLGYLYRELQKYNEEIALYQQAELLFKKVGSKSVEAKMISLAGDVYNEQKQYKQALVFYQRSRIVAQEARDKMREQSIVLKIGSAYINLENYEQGVIAVREVLLLREIKDPALEAKLLNELGQLYEKLNKIEEAIAAYQRSLVVSRSSQNMTMVQTTTINLGKLYKKSQKYAEEIALYQQAELLFREAKDGVKEAQVADLIGDAYSEQKQDEQAVKFYQKARILAREAKDKWREQRVIAAIGNIYLQQQNYEQAILVFQEALSIAREIKNQDSEARLLNDLGFVHSRLNKTEQAILFYQNSLSVSRHFKNFKMLILTSKNLGAVYSEISQYQNAIGIYQQGLEDAKASGDFNKQIEFLNLIGDIYQDSLKDYQKAIEVSQQALVIAREIKSSDSEALALDTLTRAYSSLDDSHKTIEFAQQSLAISRQIKNKLIESRALAFLGDTYASLQENRKAIEAAQQALIITREIKNSSIEALALFTLARAYGSLGDSQKTIEFAKQSLAVSQRIKNSFLEARALVFISSAYSRLGGLNDYQKSLELAQKSLTIAQELKNHDLEYLANYNLADIYHTFSEYKRAVEYAQKALLIAQELKKTEFEGQSLVLLGSAYDSLKKYDEAIEIAQKVLVIAQKLNDRALEAKALSTLSSVYNSLDKYQKALEFAQKSLAIAQEIKNPSEEISSLINLAGIYGNLGDYKRLDESSKQALALARSIKKHPLFEAVALLFRSINSFSQEDYQKTAQNAQQGLAASDAVTIPNTRANLRLINLLFLSASYSGLKNYPKAIELASQGLTMAQGQEDVNTQGIALNLLADIYRKTGQREKAMDAYGKSLSIDKEDANAHAGIARVYRDLNLPTTAIAHYKQAISKIEDTRKDIKGLPKDLQKSFLKALSGLDNVRNADIYRELADLLISQGSFGEAQQVIELLKVQELNGFSKNTRSPIPLSTFELSPTEKAILADYGGLITFIGKVTTCQAKQCADLDKLIEQRNILNKAFIDRMQGIEQQAVKDRQDGIAQRKDDFTEQAEKIVAPPKTLLIYPLVLRDRVRVLWTATGKVYGATECPIGQDQLWQATKAFHDELRTPGSLTQAQAKGKTLYDCLVAPLEGVIKNNDIQHLVFAPDLATNYIPLGALYDGKQFLIQRFTIANIVDARSTDTQATLPPKPQVLALGMSTGTAKFSPLPSVPPELASIVKTVTPKSQGVFPGIEMLNADFTQTRFAKNLRQGNFAILHFATHAAFTPTNPIDSFLLLGDGKELTIPDIQNLDGLGAVHLVVLSACQTALNDAKGGVEVRAISSYFLSRAKTVVASLWNVNDASTALMMQQFYKHLASGKTKVQALQQVQQDFILGKLTVKDADALDRAGARRYIEGQPPVDSLAHPYYWAPFILIGNSL
jgi:CHAT domain-containing protein/tetratricopeptide (TPR) repeat protein